MLNRPSRTIPSAMLTTRRQNGAVKWALTVRKSATGCGYAEQTDNGSTQALGKKLPGAAEVLFVYSPFTLSERREWRHERQTGKRHGPCSRGCVPRASAQHPRVR